MMSNQNLHLPFLLSKLYHLWGEVIHTACARGVEPCKGVAMNTTGLARKIDKELDKMYRKAKKGAVESRNKTWANSTLNVGKFYLKLAHVFFRCLRIFSSFFSR